MLSFLCFTLLILGAASQSVESSSHSAGSSLSALSQQMAQQGVSQVNGIPIPGASVTDPLSSANLPHKTDPLAPSNTLPPFSSVNSDATVSPPLAMKTSNSLSLDMDRRIKDSEDLINRMVWQLNRETSWANSVHDIIQNYQYKYTKVLSNIKKHTASVQKMRELATSLKKARLHEILQLDLAKATDELTELASTSSETSADAGSYSALKDRVALMKQDVEKMANIKVNKVLHQVQEGLKQAAQDVVPPDSADTLKGLMASDKK